MNMGNTTPPGGVGGNSASSRLGHGRVEVDWLDGVLTAQADARARDGVLQTCSGGAGTRYGPDGAFMRGDRQRHHFVDGALDEGTLSLDAIDERGGAMAGLCWPLPQVASLPGRHETRMIGPDSIILELAAVVALQVSIQSDPAPSSGRRETLLCG